jgi:DNA-binding IscR family transcriptional regulator
MRNLVAHLLANRQRIPNRTIIACLALAQLAPKPTERVSAERLMEALEISHQAYLSKLLGEMLRFDLVQYEAGDRAEPGYLFWRVGPGEAQR